jgi:hypothetical protein
MTEELPMMVGAATVFVVSDLLRALSIIATRSGSKLLLNTATQHPMRACAATKSLCICLRHVRPSACQVMGASVCS